MADFPPMHPGEVLREDFLKPLDMSQYALAQALGVPEMRISAIGPEPRSMPPSSRARADQALQKLARQRRGFGGGDSSSIPEFRIMSPDTLNSTTVSLL